ncbi:MAG TPA: nuclear transport factor 2 family protein [Vicinamibacterales bacterium]|nr:nuclear transport factor 2 family protein [Vicinamibacterales bacterium]
MKQLMRLVVAALPIVGAASFAATPAADAEIRAMEKQWNEARVKADVATLERILDRDWTVTHGDGTINTKAEYLADLKSGVRRFFADVTEDRIDVRLYGDTAVASGTSDSKVEYKGKPSGGPLRFTRVYVKRDGRWLMIVTHATRRS